MAERIDYDAIREQVGITSVLERYNILHELEERGEQLIGRCPLHKGSTMSFKVTPERNIWHCFGTGCKAGGDVVELVRYLEGYTKAERNSERRKAAKLLMEWYGIESNYSGKAEGKTRSRSEIPIDVTNAHMGQLATVRAAARSYAAAGRSVLPIAPGAKRPSLPSASGSPQDIKWRHFQQHKAGAEQIAQWFTHERIGLAIVCGAVSAPEPYGLEIIDIDDYDTVLAFTELATYYGLSQLIESLPAERTPRGGVHIGYLCAEYQGSQILAARPTDPLDHTTTLIETRGEGGIFVAAPTPPGIHPVAPDRGYEMIRGSWTDVPAIDPTERDALFTIARELNEREAVTEHRAYANRARKEKPVMSALHHNSVKERVSFEEVFEFYRLRWEGKGDELILCCPFHDDHEPSLKANSKKGGWQCFGASCKKKGNVIHFVADMEGLTYREAALFLQAEFIVDEPERHSLEHIEPPPETKTPSNPSGQSTKRTGYMQEVETKLRNLLDAGDDNATVKWVKEELLASYRRGQASSAEAK